MTGSNKIIFTTGISLLLSVLCVAQEADTVAPSIEKHNKLNATVLYYDAVRARHKGDNAEAEKLLKNVVKFDPEAAGAYYDLARINLQRKQFSEASKNIQKAMKLEPQNKWYREQYAMLLLEQNKFTEAAQVYEEIANAENNNKDYLQTLALLYQRAGDSKKAIQTLDRLLSVYGNDEEILERKLLLYLNNNELDKAMEINNLLIELTPDDSKYYVRLAEMYLNNNQPEKAAEVYRKAEEIFPDDPSLQLSMSEYYRTTGDREKYKAYLRRVVTNNALGATEQLSVLSAFILSSTDSADRAFGLDMAADVAGNNATDARALALYGDMLALSDKPEEAAEQYKKSVEIDPSNYLVWKNLLSVSQQNADSLIKYSERALRIFPNQAQVHFMNGLAHYEKKDHKKAINAIERAIDMMPEENRGELATLHSVLADAYNSIKDYEASDEHFRISLELLPDNATALNNYSYYLSERGERLDEAEKMSKRSLELAPDQPTFLDTYGWIMYKQGNYKKAKEYIEKAIELEEQSASGTLWDHLGDIYYKLGNVQKAVECWMKAKDLGTDNADIDKKIKNKVLYE